MVLGVVAPNGARGIVIVPIPRFIRGDVNGDGKIGVTDAAFLAAAFSGLQDLHCPEAADVRNDNQLIPRGGGSDVGALLAWLVELSPVGTNVQLPAPFPSFGQDPSLFGLGCENGGVSPPGGTNAAYSVRLRASQLEFEPKDQVRFRLDVTTGAAVHGFSVPFLLNSDLFKVATVRLLGGAGAGGAEGAQLAWDVKPSDEAGFVLVNLAVVLVGTNGQPISSALTAGSVEHLNVLDVVAVVKAVDDGLYEITRPFTGVYADIGNVGGLHTEFGDTQGLPQIPHDPGDFPGIGLAGEIPFLRGDANGDGSVNVADPFYTLRAIFQSDSSFPGHRKGADMTDDTQVNILDAMSTLDFLFTAAFVPGDPFPSCGGDPSPSGTPEFLMNFEINDPPTCPGS